MGKVEEFTVDTQNGQHIIVTNPDNITLVKETRPREKYEARISPGIVLPLSASDFKVFKDLLQK